MEWHQTVSEITPQIVKIETQDGAGTGFLFLYNEDKTICGIATALHTVENANKWEQPIQIQHFDSGQTVLLENDKRAIFPDGETDSAAIVFLKDNLSLPDSVIPLSDSIISTGVEVGWLGFPSVARDTLCFFSGKISAPQTFRKAYFIDGVAIHGVSGGPVIFAHEDYETQIVGMVTEYHPNRATGEALPGLLIAQDVSHLREVARRIKSIEEALALISSLNASP